MHRVHWMASASVLAMLTACVQVTTAPPHGGGPPRPTGQPSVPFTELLSVLEGAGYVVNRVIKDDQSASPGGGTSVQTGVVVVSPNSCLPKVQAVVFGKGIAANPDAPKEAVTAATPSPGALRYEAYQVLAADQLKYGADQASATTVIKVESC